MSYRFKSIFTSRQIGGKKVGPDYFRTLSKDATKRACMPLSIARGLAGWLGKGTGADGQSNSFTCLATQNSFLPPSDTNRHITPCSAPGANSYMSRARKGIEPTSIERQASSQARNSLCDLFFLCLCCHKRKTQRQTHAG